MQPVSPFSSGYAPYRPIPAYRAIPAYKTAVNSDTLTFASRSQMVLHAPKFGHQTARVIKLPSYRDFNPDHLLARLRAEGVDVKDGGVARITKKTDISHVILYVGKMPTAHEAMDMPSIDWDSIGYREVPPGEQNYSEAFYARIKGMLEKTTDE